MDKTFICPRNEICGSPNCGHIIPHVEEEICNENWCYAIHREVKCIEFNKTRSKE